MGDDDYRPREHDHLVEPVFGGLLGEPRPAPEPHNGALARLWRWLKRLFGRTE